MALNNAKHLDMPTQRAAQSGQPGDMHPEEID